GVSRGKCCSTRTINDDRINTLYQCFRGKLVRCWRSRRRDCRRFHKEYGLLKARAECSGTSVTVLKFQALSTTSVSTFVFDADAPSSSFSLIGDLKRNSPSLSFSGLGIINDSSFASSFVITLGNLSFLNSSSADNASFTTSGIITSTGLTSGGGLNFENTSSAGAATIINNPGGITNFHDSSTAAAANVVNNFDILFFETSNAGTAHIDNTGVAIIINGNTVWTNAADPIQAEYSGRRTRPRLRSSALAQDRGSSVRRPGPCPHATKTEAASR